MSRCFWCRCEPGRFAVRGGARAVPGSQRVRTDWRETVLANPRALRLNRLVKAQPNPRPNGPPHNPGVRELVAGKRKWASSLTPEQAKAGFKGWHERGYLPHRDEPGLTQMVTFHVADSFPTALRGEWAALLEIEDDAERRIKLQAYLDKGRGECPLRNPLLVHQQVNYVT